MYTVASTPATFADGRLVDPKTLSTPDQAANLLALLNTVVGFPSGSTIITQETENFDGSGYAFQANGETRTMQVILVGGSKGVPLNVGELIYSMGGLNSAGAFTCQPPLGSPTDPVWVPAQPVAPVTPIVVPVSPGPGYVWTEVGPGFWTWEKPAAPAVTPASTGLSASDVVTLESLLPRLAALCAMFGK